MDLGRDVITKAIDCTEAERAFQPWWVTVQHYLVYSLVILGTQFFFFYFMKAIFFYYILLHNNSLSQV